MDKKRILIVDDEDDLAQLIKINLEDTGKYQVRVENEGLKTIPAAREFKPHLILLDILLPDKDGGEVASDLKVEQDLKNIPIVFLTAIVSTDEVTSRNDYIGGHPFVAKPVDINDLINIIEKNIPSK